MKCENCFCVYEYNGNCRLEEIELDITGQCMQCIYITPNEAALNIAKIKTLKSLKNRRGE